MKAMILAAGLGTRLRPLTDDRPKALVSVAGHTLLEIVLYRLRAFGIREVIINTHHYAEMIVDYLHANHNFGMTIAISREEVLLDTGGGLKRAANFFLSPGSSPDEPFLLHNVDVLSSIDLAQMTRFHIEHNALATLAVQDRKTSRYLLFDEQGQLCGRRTSASGEEGNKKLSHPAQHPQALAFSGIQILSPRILAKIEEEGVFSIIPVYLRLAASQDKILAFRADQCYWADLGRPESITQTTLDIQNGTYPDPVPLHPTQATKNQP